MTIKIVLPKSEKGQATPVIGTKIYTENGSEINGFIGINIHTDIGDNVTATIDVVVDDIKGMDNVHALLGTKTLEQIAALHGFALNAPISSKIAEVDFKVDCSEIEEIQATLDVLAKYADELPQAMKDELAEIIKEK
jgi:hypothetical protein